MYNWYHIALVFWFILLTIIYSRSIHVVTTGRISSFLMTKLLCMYTTCVFSMHLLMSIWAVSIFGQCEYALPCLLKRYSQAVPLKGCYSSHIQSILPWTNGKKRGSRPSTERDRNTIRNLFSFFFRVSFLPCPNFVDETTCVEPTLQFSSEVQKWLHGSSMSFQILIPRCVKSPRKLEENAFLPEQGRKGCRLKDIPMFYSWKDVGGLRVLIITIIIVFIFNLRCREWG